jgi:hypothetical protein
LPFLDHEPGRMDMMLEKWNDKKGLAQVELRKKQGRLNSGGGIQEDGQVQEWNPVWRNDNGSLGDSTTSRGKAIRYSLEKKGI